MLFRKTKSGLGQFIANVFKTRGIHSTPGWPVMAGAFLLLCATIALVSTAWIKYQTQQVTTQLITIQNEQTVWDGLAKSPVEPLTMAPDGREYLHDLGRILELAKKDEVRIGVVDYKLRAIEGTPLTLRSVDFRVNEDYPKIKGFISHVLGTLPNIALQEIRIERKDSAALQGAIMLRFSLVYKSAGEMRTSALQPK